MKKMLLLSIIAISLSACSTSTNSLEQSGFLYPHSNSPYLMGAPAKTYKPPKEVSNVSVKPSSINPNAISSQGHTLASSSIKKREIAIINAPYNRVFQELIKFCSINDYHILKQNYKEGFIRCDITTNTAQYYENTTPTMVSKFVLNAPSLGGLAAWTLNMDIFITPGNGKTMIEFIPKYYAVSMNSKGKLVLTSNGYFENSAINFIENDIKEFP